MFQKINDWIRLNYRNLIIGSLVLVPLLVSLISTIHVVNFFKLSNYGWLAITLAIAFEIGALSSLAALAVMDKINKISLWSIFILITLMQMMGNTYYAFDFISIKMNTTPEWTQNWIDLFSIQGESVPTTKRILAIVSGAILPIISLTFLHMLVTYISKSKKSDDVEYEYVTVDENGDVIDDTQELENKPIISKEKEPVPQSINDDTDFDYKIYESVPEVDTYDNEIVEEISDVGMEKDMTFTPDKDGIENLNGSSPQKKKILLYKEKKN